MVLGLVLSATAMVVGVVWDISWDASIGADSFWSPPHMAVNFGAAAAGLIALIGLVGAGGGARPRIQRVGAGSVVWGALAMLGWLILDDWWGQAYGLFGERWNPPELLFLVSAGAILLGTMASVVGSAASTSNSWLSCWVAGMAMVFAVAAMTPYGLPNLQRTATFYFAASAVFPGLLLLAARSASGGWGASAAACAYSATMCALIWILPRFAAQPAIGPIYHPVETFLPPSFPLLVAAPALAMDWALRRLDGDWLGAALLGAVFVGVFLPIQWAFSGFLLSPAADNAFFAGGGRYWPFYAQVGPERTMFWGAEQDPLVAVRVLACFLVASVSARLGLFVGTSMTRGRR